MTDRAPLCADQSCPMSLFEHDAHDGYQSRVPVDENCADPDCDMAWVEHEAHQPTIEGELARSLPTCGPDTDVKVVES